MNDYNLTYKRKNYGVLLLTVGIIFALLSGYLFFQCDPIKTPFWFFMLACTFGFLSVLTLVFGITAIFENCHISSSEMARVTMLRKSSPVLDKALNIYLKQGGILVKVDMEDLNDFLSCGDKYHCHDSYGLGLALEKVLFEKSKNKSLD